MVKIEELNRKEQPTWCPGCGNYSILLSIKNAITKLKLNPWEVILVTGIGCSSKDSEWVNTYGFHGLHGRSLPFATGVKLSNNKLNVIVAGGDGDQYGIGLNHFMQILRRNLDLTLIVHNNQIYGLTKGQYSPTSDRGFKSKTSVYGSIEEASNPIALAITGGATFVARGYAGDADHLISLICEGIKHKGFALIDVLQPCVTFNHKNTFEWYEKRIYYLDKVKHDFKNKEKALKRAFEWDGGNSKIPIGVFYKVKKKTYEDYLPQLKKPLVKQNIENININKLLKKLM